MSPATHMTGAPTPDWVLIAPALALAAIGLFAATMFGIWAWRHRRYHARLCDLADRWDLDTRSYLEWRDYWQEKGLNTTARVARIRAEMAVKHVTELRRLLDRT